MEPPTEGNALFGARNIVITPNIAWASTEARQRLMAGVLGNLRGFLEGKVVNKVS
jgi:glycerate dehydrogenase